MYLLPSISTRLIFLPFAPRSREACNLTFHMKPDLPLRPLGLGHQPTDGFKDGADLLVVGANAAFELGKLVGELLVRREDASETNERTDNEDAHLNGTGTVENVGRHDDPMFSEDKGQFPPTTMDGS